MRSYWIVAIAVTALFVGLVAGRVTAEEKGAPEPRKPGPEHAEIAKAVGAWDAHIKFWMPGQDEPEEGKDGCVIESILGGWFLKMDYTGNYQGQTWKGMLLGGYDQVRKEYVHIWMSEHGSDMAISRGNKDEDGVLEMRGESIDHQTGKPRDSLTTFEWEDENTVVMTMYWITDGEADEDPMLEITYKRKGA